MPRPPYGGRGASPKKITWSRGGSRRLLLLAVLLALASFRCSRRRGRSGGGAAAGVSAAIGAAAFGMSAAIAAAARPKLNKAEVIRVPDLFMRSPTVV